MAQKRRKNRKSAADATAKAPDPRELSIPDSVIEQILEAMEVPETSWSDTSWSDAAWKVREAVESCVESFADGRPGANKNRYKVIESTSDRLLRELSKLNTTERRHFGENLQKFERTERRHFGENLQKFERGLGDIKRTAFYLAAAPRPRHRPRDSVKYPHIRDLIYDLENVAGDHGKELTFYLEAGKKKGSLQDILYILHDLSPEIFPADAAFNTFKEMRFWAERKLNDKAQEYLSNLDQDDSIFSDDDDRSA